MEKDGTHGGRLICGSHYSDESDQCSPGSPRVIRDTVERSSGSGWVSRACERRSSCRRPRGPGDTFKSVVTLKTDFEGWVECWQLELVEGSPHRGLKTGMLGDTWGTCDIWRAEAEGEDVPSQCRGPSIEQNSSDLCQKRPLVTNCCCWVRRGDGKVTGPSLGFQTHFSASKCSSALGSC